MKIIDELVAVLGFDIKGEDEAERFNNKLDQLSEKTNKLAVSAGKYAALGTTLLATGFGLMGKSVISTSGNFERFGAILETIEGSSEKAEKSLDWISNFARTTPYKVEELTDSFVKLKAYGIDPIADDTLKILGDTASAMGKPLMQAVEAIADAATGEFERLKEFGIKANAKGEEVTFAWTKNGKQLTKTVKKNSEEIRKFLLDNFGQRFNGAMLKQSKKWRGMLSNLSDNWTYFLRKTGDGGIFNTVKKHLGDLLDYIGKLDRDGTLERWSENVSDSMDLVANTVVKVAKRVTTHVSFLSKHFDKFAWLVKLLGIAVSLLIMRAFPLLTIFSLLAFVVEDFLTYLEGGESLIGRFIEKIQELTGVSEGTAQTFAGLATTIIASLASWLLFAPLKFIGYFKGLFVGGLKKIVRLAGRIAKSIARSFGVWLIRGLTLLGPLVLKGAVAAFALLSNPIGWAVILGAAAAGLIYYFWDDIVKLWNGLSDQATSLFSSLSDWILNIGWVDTGIKIMSALWDGMKLIGEKLSAWVSNLLPDWAVNFIGDSKGAKFNSSAGVVNRDQRSTSSRYINNNVTVNQSVSQPTQAPGAAARATGNAVRAQIEAEPTMP